MGVIHDIYTSLTKSTGIWVNNAAICFILESAVGGEIFECSLVTVTLGVLGAGMLRFFTMQSVNVIQCAIWFTV